MLFLMELNCFLKVLITRQTAIPRKEKVKFLVDTMMNTVTITLSGNLKSLTLINPSGKSKLTLVYYYKQLNYIYFLNVKI